LVREEPLNGLLADGHLRSVLECLQRCSYRTNREMSIHSIALPSALEPFYVLKGQLDQWTTRSYTGV
jgi:hypothetical protein